MSWNELKPQAALVASPVGFSLGLYGVGKRLTAAILLRGGFCREHWLDAESRFRVKRGTGAEHGGKILLALDPDGPFHPIQTSKSGLSVKFPPPDDWPQVRILRRGSDYTAAGGGGALTIEIELPKELRDARSFADAAAGANAKGAGVGGPVHRSAAREGGAAGANAKDRGVGGPPVPAGALKANEAKLLAAIEGFGATPPDMSFAFMAQAAGIPTGSVSNALQGLKDHRRIERVETLTGVTYRPLNPEASED